MFKILFYFCDCKCGSLVSKNTNAGPKAPDDTIDCRQIKKISITKLVKISQNLFSLVMTTLSFGKKCFWNGCWYKIYAFTRNWHHFMSVFLRIRLRQIFQKCRYCNHFSLVQVCKCLLVEELESFMREKKIVILIT